MMEMTMRSQTFKILTGQQLEIANAIAERRLADLEAYKTRTTGGAS
jgi:hypothetical protein